MAAAVAGNALEFFDFVIAAAVRVQTATKGRNLWITAFCGVSLWALARRKSPQTGALIPRPLPLIGEAPESALQAGG